MRKILLAIVVCIAAFATQAQAAFKGCYERVYDKKHLASHRKQEVVKIRLQIGVGQGNDGPFELLDRIDAGFRKRAIYDGNLIECEAVGDELSCAIEGDGGTFTVTDRGENSIRITNNSYMRFGDEDGTEITAKGEHREFRLFRVRETSCP